MGIKEDKRKSIHIALVLDASGSMQYNSEAFLSGLRSFAKEMSDEYAGTMSLTLFNSSVEHVFSKTMKAASEAVNDLAYSPSGTTALYSAILSTIEKHKRKRNQVIVAVMTDGMENASEGVTSTDVKNAVEAMEERGWSFMFLAAGLDAEKVGEIMGISLERSVSFPNSALGYKSAYATMGQTVSSMVNDASN